VLAKNSGLHPITFQKHAPFITVSVDADTTFVLSFDDSLSDSSVTYGLELLFATPDVTAEIRAAYRLSQGQTLNLTTIANHKAPRTACLTSVRGVLDADAVSNFVGKILIAKDAQQTKSFLKHNVLVIGENTKNSSEPILQIEADDVKASHGATTGRIDEQQLYYLVSRGLSRKDAENLIISGFLKV
jgi:Fe-S cluster assembly protein SufD